VPSLLKPLSSGSHSLAPTALNMHRSLALVCVFILALSVVKAFPSGAPSSACPTNAMTLNMAGAGRHHPIVYDCIPIVIFFHASHVDSNHICIFLAPLAVPLPPRLRIRSFIHSGGNGGYSLTAAATSWAAGTPVALQLRGNAAWTGILIVGYKSGTTTQVGTWVVSQGYKLVSGRPAAITQSSGGRKGPTVAFSWMPPAAGTGSVDFRALVVPSDRAAYLLDIALRLTERGALISCLC
jgi:hypothetical protein